jgi:hypothetical protein
MNINCEVHQDAVSWITRSFLSPNISLNILFISICNAPFFRSKVKRLKLSVCLLSTPWRSTNAVKLITKILKFLRRSCVVSFTFRRLYINKLAPVIQRIRSSGFPTIDLVNYYFVKGSYFHFIMFFNKWLYFFGFQGWAAPNVESCPAFLRTLQLHCIAVTTVVFSENVDNSQYLTRFIPASRRFTSNSSRLNPRTKIKWLVLNVTIV